MAESAQTAAGDRPGQPADAAPSPTPAASPAPPQGGGRQPGHVSWLRRNAVANGLRNLLFGDPLVPMRLQLLRALDRRLGLVRDYRRRLDYDLVERPHYGHCLLHAATLARKLGHARVSAIEFGVAGGNGLLALERHAKEVRAATGVEVAVYGFDTGRGMPPPRDHRDLPYMWQAGYFAMDVEALRARLTTAHLVLGEVAETLPGFTGREDPPPIGFVAFDLDYYSSTVEALRILEADHRHLLPRVACYFDDIVGDVDWAYGPFAGELLAIEEFNAAHERAKIARVHGLRFWGRRVPRPWHEQVFVAHLFAHPDYGRPTSELTQIPLEAA